MNWRLLFFVFLLTNLVGAPVLAKQAVTNNITIESGFSPDGSAEQLILKTINSAKKSIRLAAYSFTSPKIVDALLKAKKRGVDIRLIVDYKQNIKLDNNGKSKAALNLLVNAKIPVRIMASKTTLHSKYMIIDNKHIQTGSYNYSAAAARYNQENVLVIYNQPALVKEYKANWDGLFEQGTPYQSSY